MAAAIGISTRRFERWLGAMLHLRRDDLAYKHEMMAADPFSFLRATFYRWAELWPKALPDLSQAPTVLAIGDLHVENYGTWRDAEGRLVWGINDFDETAWMPYTIDLVRLATSAGLAAAEGHLDIDLKDACDSILRGYRRALRMNGKPFVLAENDRWLRKLAQGRLRDPVVFWGNLNSLPTARGPIPERAQSLLLERLPPGVDRVRFGRRRSGMGSLGRDRVVAIADWHGSLIAHEAKALAPSAWEWANPARARGHILYQELAGAAVRCPDPTVEVSQSWLVRRLSPDCSRIELDSLPKSRDEGRLLKAMGWEAANIHLATTGARKLIISDLARRKTGWLRDASTQMSRLLRDDWKAWRSAPK